MNVIGIVWFLDEKIKDKRGGKKVNVRKRRKSKEKDKKKMGKRWLKISSHDNMYSLGRITDMQATVLFIQERFEEAKSANLCAADIYEKVGATGELKSCRETLLFFLGKALSDW